MWWSCWEGWEQIIIVISIASNVLGFKICSWWRVCHQNFGPENFGPPDQNFRENWSTSGNLVLVEVRITTGLTIGKSIVWYKSLLAEDNCSTICVYSIKKFARYMVRFLACVQFTFYSFYSTTIALSSICALQCVCMCHDTTACNIHCKVSSCLGNVLAYDNGSECQ